MPNRLIAQAATLVLFLLLTSLASAQTITVGETSVLSSSDSGNRNLLIAQQTTLAQPATLQSLSIYVTGYFGQVRLGVYDATGPGGGPGAKKAETSSFSPSSGWNTISVSPVQLSAGTYWLAYTTSSSYRTFRQESTGTARYYSRSFGTMPTTFSTSATAQTAHWSFYATLSPQAASPAAPTVNLSANPTSIQTGGSTTVAWSSTNTTSCVASGAWSGSQPLSGQTTISPPSTATYTLTCSGAGGSTAKSVTVSVAAASPAPTVSLSADPTSIQAGGSATIAWSSTNATSCAASGAWSGSRALSGQTTMSPSSTSTYTLACSGTGGTASQSVTINVNAAAPPPSTRSACRSKRGTRRTVSAVSCARPAVPARC